MRNRETNQTSTPRLALTVSLACAAIYLTALVAPGQCKDNSLRSIKSPLKTSEVSQSSSVSWSSSPLGEFSRAESGVKLLVGIFARLGNEPQLALKNDSRLLAASKNKSGFDRDSQSQLLAAVQNNASANFQSRNNQFGNSINNQYTDPALAIRPRTVSRKTAADKFIPIQGVTIAMAPQKKSFYKGESRDEKRDERNSAAGLGGAAPQAENSKSEPERKSEADSYNSLRSRDDSSVKIFAGPSSTSNALPAGVGEKTYIREFGKATNAPAAPAVATNSRSLERGINVMEESIIASRRQSPLKAEETANGIIRPTEQPGLFKYVREHLKETPKDSPRENAKENNKDFASSGQSVASLDQLSEGKATYKQKLKSAKLQSSSPASIVSDNEVTLEAQQDGAALQIAFLPPSTVHGINGLPLGATEADTAKFFKNRGNLSRSFISGWKVWTLLDQQQNPILQVYLRNGRTEAFRIFNQSYVPAGLGVAINDELPSMKGKFGEPAFILEEPGIKPQLASQQSAMVAKNYVYPVSQVSFQLVRSGPNSPQIHSLLLFRYL
ncbi:hypothetical protein KA344_14170 [bacterium]|jgi:hypothetical protein|nr:hypothetical protein [bacterium]